MRSNVETRRCGCGLILGLREGCQRCADAARAKLHASGVAAHEEMPVLKTGERSTKELLDNWWKAATTRAELDRALATLGVKPKHEAPPALQGETGVCGGGWSPVLKNEPPPVGAEVSYDEALEDMKRRPEARYSRAMGAVQSNWEFTDRFPYRWHGGLVFKLMNWSTSSDGDIEHATRLWKRLPDAT